MAQQTTIKVPKRIPVEVIRKVLGDKETERLLIGGYGPSLMRVPMVKVERPTLQNLLTILNGDLPEGMTPAAAKQVIPPWCRLYFSEVPFVTQRLKRWVRLKVDELEETGEIKGAILKEHSATPVRKKRKK